MHVKIQGDRSCCQVNDDFRGIFQTFCPRAEQSSNGSFSSPSVLSYCCTLTAQYKNGVVIYNITKHSDQKQTFVKKAKQSALVGECRFRYMLTCVYTI